MLSISDFSEMCYLSPQTLRYYHSEGLLVPADVDPQTGYRSYTFEQVEQVEQAMLITSLRGTGMSIKLVRRALDEPTGLDPYDWTAAEFATALSRLTTYPLDNAYADLSRMRQVLHDDGVETALAVRQLEEADVTG